MALFDCTQCGKQLRWTASLAGHRVRCSCGAVLICPVEQPPAAETYDLATETTNPQATAHSTPTPTATPRVTPTLAYRTPTDDAKGKADPETIKNLYMPLWLLGGGVAVEVIAAIFKETGAISHSIARVGMELVIGTMLMLVGILLAARFRRFSVGPLPTVLFKLSAISVAPAAVVALFTPILNLIPFGGILGWVGQFVIYFALLGVLFDLDESDTWYCVCVIFLVNLAVYFLTMWGIAKWG